MDGVAFRVDTRKAVAALAYLALEGAQTREHVAALLWPESDESRARGALRRTLSVMGKALGGAALEVTPARIELRREVADCDAWRLRGTLDGVATHGHDDPWTCAGCLAALEDARRLHRGPFLAGFSLRDSAPFETWQQLQDQHLLRDHVGVLDLLVDHLAARGEFDTAAEHAESRLDIDPLDERTHRRLMLLHAWQGRRPEAVRQYRECVAILDRELGVAPLDETTALYGAILEDRAPPAPIASSASAPTVPIEPSGPLPLVGRDHQIALLDQHLDEGSSSGRLLVVEGEPGIGKTRMLEELADRAEGGGHRVLTTRCHEGEDRIPYGPLAELLRAAAATWPETVAAATAHDLAEVARLVPEVAPPRVAAAAPLDGPGAQARFFEGVTRVLTDAVGAGGVVMIDDVHWADRSTADVLAYLTRRLGARRIVLAWSWREDDTAPRQLLRRAAASAAADGSAAILPLQRLERGQVRELVAAVTGRRTGADRLYTETEGLPFLLSAYLADVPATGRRSWELPGTARDRLLARLDEVTGVARQLLTTAAVIGRRFDVATLRAAAGRSDDETVAGLEELLGRGVVREVPGADPAATYDFTHDKLRALAYETATAARRRLLHGRVAEALRTVDDPAAAGVAAVHLEQAGRFEEAAEQHRRAGDHARSLYANREALEHYRSALALGHHDLTALHEAIGDLATLSGDYPLAIASYETAAAHRTEATAIAALEHKLAGVHLRCGDRDAADAHLRAALELLPDPAATAQRARVMAERSLAALRSHDLHESRAAAEEALELATAAGDAASIAQAHNVLGVLARRRGDLDAAASHLDASLGLATDLVDPSARAAALNNLGLVRRTAGDSEAAVELHREALALCQEVGDRHREAAVLNNLADALHSAGRRDEAMRVLKRAVRRFSEVGGLDSPGPQPEIWKLVDW
ncbi:MAG: AAA family ATPase [Actinobacteria bacterium]|nr:AAA family ATPase [Actinomycetota bacterium]